MASENRFFQSLNLLHPSSIKELSFRVIKLLEDKLWAKILFGMALGIAVGALLSPGGFFGAALRPFSQEIDTLMNWLALPAKFFLKLIQMVIIPLIIASIMRGIASTESVQQMKTLGLKFSLFVLATSATATAIAFILASIFNAGKDLHLPGAPQNIQNDLSPLELHPDQLVNLLPLNPLASIVEGHMIDVVVLALLGGIALVSIEKRQAKGIIDFLEVIQELAMTIISWAMKLAPLAVFGMMAQVTSSTGSLALKSMGVYLFATFIGYAVMITCYLVIVLVMTKTSPRSFLKSCASPMLLAFSTSSSAATMPITMKVAEEDLGADPTVARFLIPLGTTINMAGTALWQTSAVVFICNAYNLNISIGQMAFIAVTAIGSAIGSPGVPGVGIGIVSMVLVKVGIPPEGVSLILGVDRLMDMGCTVLNVTGDLVATKILGNKPSFDPE